MPTQGTIVDVRPGRHEHHYLIDARNRNGSMIQREVKHRSPQPYTVGSTVRVEISALNEIRFDPNAPGGDPVISTMTVADQIAEASAAFDRPGAAHGPSFDRLSGLGVRSATFNVSYGSYGSSGAQAKLGGLPDQMSGLMAGGIEGLASAIGAIVGDATHITGADGQQYQVDPAEMQRLTQALHGDSAERMAARKQLHRIRAAAMAQVAKRAADGALGQVGGAALAGGGGLAAAVARSGHVSVEDRLAKLQELLSKGIVTQSEYDTQRQRIIEGI
jgi:hypothetical protein